MEIIKDLLLNYGYIAIFGIIFLELIALPLPGELMMTYTGFLVGQNYLNWFLSIVFAFIGTMVGMTVTYFVGRFLGETFFAKYGRFFHMGPKQLEKAKIWFEKYGNRLIIVAYFIPGVRHVTGYFSGISGLPFKKFALFAYTGGAIWVCTFISMGKVLGDSWEQYHRQISVYLTVASVIISIIIILVLAYKYYREKIFRFVLDSLRKSVVIFHSMGRVKFVVAVVGFLFIIIFAFAIETIQDYLFNQYSTFNTVIKYFTFRSFGHEWQSIFNLFEYITSLYGLAIIFVLSVSWIYFNGKDKKLEYIFSFITIWGGLAVQIILAKLFENLVPLKNLYNVSKTAFPGREGVVAISAIGFLTFITIRHSIKYIPKAFKIVIAMVLVFLISAGTIYNGTLDPSSLIAGLEIGGAWLFLNIILLEIFRVLPRIANSTKSSSDGPDQ